ncbi:unnamed protein product [Phytophthora lilii]|uniref:Unnamed protein product n=1 Tax=Phytophthora lilii TaxID=2077276 RepID=A0A9W6TGI6_9STRA|nr:unnamed protein product [Phytophthora lilii]
MERAVADRGDSDAATLLLSPAWRSAGSQRRWSEPLQLERAKLTLRPGIVLFDPKDLEGAADWKRTLTVELLEDNQEDDEDDAEEDNQEDNDEDPDSPAAKQVRLRARVIEEICETEKSYVRDIRTLLDHYIVALEDNSHPIMRDDQIAVFFNNLRHLVMLNSKLLTDLLEIVQRRAAAAAAQKKGKRKCVKSPVAVAVQCEAEGVGAVFCRYAPLFKFYGGYAKDYEEVAALLKNFKQDTRLGFSQFLETCRERSGSPKPFESLLIMPIQRIPRYKLLLERLSELTPPDHPDAAFLVEAVNRVRAAASLINETVRRQENLETVLQAQQQFAGQLSLFTADRRLLKSGKLTKMSTKRQEDVMIHLFNDILLYSGILITGGYRVRRIVHLHSKAVGVKTELPTAVQALFQQQSRRRVRKDCGFVVTSREKTFILFAERPEAQHEWVDAIAGAVKDAQRLKQAERGEGGDADGNNPEACEGPADAAALWVPDEVADVCTICKASFRAYYRRKHHCRRCGAVVCDTCSLGRAPLFVGESSRAERVCTPCFKILDLVRQVAMHWLSRVVEFRGVLRRRHISNKWIEHYYELRAGVLKQFTLETASASITPVAQNGNGSAFTSSGNAGAVVVGGAVSGAGVGNNAVRSCTDELALAGAIVIHRSDSRAHKNRFCFQISTSEYDDCDSEPNAGSNSSTRRKSSPMRRLSQPTLRPHLMKKLSPLKQAVSRIGDAVTRRRDPATSSEILSRDSTVPQSSPQSQLPVPAASPTASVPSSSASVMPTVRESEWVLCASTIQEEVAWRVAIQSSADKALNRMRRSRVTDFPGSLAQSGILSLSMSMPSSSLRASMSVISGSSFLGGAAGRRRMSSLDRGRATDAELSMELAQAAGEDREAYLLERRRRQILKEIIRSEESYVQCLGECIRLFVQPLLLRQLEGRQMYRRRQNKRRSSLRPVPVLGGPLTTSARHGLAAPTRGHRRAGSSGSIGITKGGGSSSSLHSMMMTASYSVAAAASSASSLSSTSAPAPKMLVMDADLSIFFSSVDQIYTLNQQLLDHLSRHLEETSATPALPAQSEDGQTVQQESAESTEFPGVKVHRAGAIFHAYAPLMQLYTSYASRHSSALTALDSPQFAGFLRELPDEADVNRLRRYLNMPVERIPRYKMLLQELLGSTPPEHVDFVPLQSAIRSVDRVASKIEEISERRENARTLATLLVDNDDDSSSGYELEGFVIKNGWLNVSGGAVATVSGPTGSPSPTPSSSVGKKARRLWITLTLQTISLGSTFKAAQPEETIAIELCEVAPLKNEKCFRLQFLHDTVRICLVTSKCCHFYVADVITRVLTHSVSLDRSVVWCL